MNTSMAARRRNRPIGCLERCIFRKSPEDINEIITNNRNNYFNGNVNEAQALLVSGLAVLATPSEPNDYLYNKHTQYGRNPQRTIRSNDPQRISGKNLYQAPADSHRSLTSQDKLQLESPMTNVGVLEIQRPANTYKEKRRLRVNGSGRRSEYPNDQIEEPRSVFPTFSKKSSLPDPSCGNRVHPRTDDLGSVFTTGPRIKNLPGGGDVRKVTCGTDEMIHYQEVFRRRMVKDANLMEVINRTDQENKIALAKRADGGMRYNHNVHMPLAKKSCKETRVGGVWRLVKKVGSGSFGEIYEGISVIDGERVAVKLEHLSRGNPHLIHECKVYASLSGCPGTPSIKWAGVEGEFTVMVIELMGPSLEDRFQYCGKMLDAACTAMLGVQMIERLRDLHTHTDYIHRDIKPHNFLIGLGANSSRVSLIDFGLAKKYRDVNGNHMPFSDGNSLTGTARYVSIGTHLGHLQSRRDDLESIGYVLIYFLKGVLPWQGLSGDKATKYDNIMKSKIKTTLDDLAEGIPAQYAEYVTYCRKLEYDADPDYSKLIQLVAATHPSGSLPKPLKLDWFQKCDIKRKALR